MCACVRKLYLLSELQSVLNFMNINKCLLKLLKHGSYYFLDHPPELLSES